MARSKHQSSGPFTRQDYETLVETERSLSDLIGKCDKAEACGIQVGVWRQQRDQIASQLAAIKQHFMTPPPA